MAGRGLAAGARRPGREPVLGAAAEPCDRPGQARVLDGRLRTSSAQRSASVIICSNASSVSTSASVARIAASDSALPASVPPTPPTSDVGVARRLGRDPVGDLVV